MRYALNRLSEPSTYAGVAAFAATLGVSLPTSVIQYGSLVLAGIAGLVAAMLPDKSA